MATHLPRRISARAAAAGVAGDAALSVPRGFAPARSLRHALGPVCSHAGGVARSDSASRQHSAAERHWISYFAAKCNKRGRYTCEIVSQQLVHFPVPGSLMWRFTPLQKATIDPYAQDSTMRGSRHRSTAGSGAGRSPLTALPTRVLLPQQSELLPLQTAVPLKPSMKNQEPNAACHPHPSDHAWSMFGAESWSMLDAG